MVSYESVKSAPAPFKQKGGCAPEPEWTLRRKEKFLPPARNLDAVPVLSSLQPYNTIDYVTLIILIIRLQRINKY